MISRLGRLLIVVVLFVLVVLGLNTSNHGINELTMNSRGPVLALDVGRDDVTVQFLGEDYTYAEDRLTKINLPLQGKIEGVYVKGKNYLLKIWEIFEVVFLYEVE